LKSGAKLYTEITFLFNNVYGCLAPINQATLVNPIFGEFESVERSNFKFEKNFECNGLSCIRRIGNKTPLRMQFIEITIH